MWLLDPNFDWNDQLAREYLKFRGQYYDVGTKVKIINGAKKGKIEIEYYGGTDLERILKLLQL